MSEDLLEDLGPALEILASFGRDLLLIHDGGDPALLLNPDRESELHDHSARMGRDRALSLLAAIDDCLHALDRNVNVKVAVSSLTLQFMDGQHV